MDKLACPLDMKYMRGTVATEIQPVSAGYKNPGPTENLRGIETNTARHVKGAVQLHDIISIATAPSTPAAVYAPCFRTYGE